MFKVTRLGFLLRKSWFHLKSDPMGPWTAIIKVFFSSQVVFIWPSCREFLDIYVSSTQNEDLDCDP